MLFSDLRELKIAMEIEPGNTQEDVKLMFFLEWATRWIEELLNRPGFTYKERTEYYEGTGTPKLLLRSRPVYTTPTVRVWVDSQAYYGASADAFGSQTELTYGTHFTIPVRESGQPSRAGVLVRLNNVWPKPAIRQVGYLSPFVGPDPGSIKVTYTGGYTVNDMPAQIRMATVQLVSKMRYLFPLGMELSGEGYEERSISVLANSKTYLLKGVADLIHPYRNWKW